MDSIDTEIRTERLLLRRLRPDDVADMFEYTSDPESSRLLHWDAHTDISQTKSFVDNVVASYRKGNSHVYGMELVAESKLIGAVRIFDISWQNRRCEFSFILSRRYQGQGFVGEAMTSVLRHLLDVGQFMRIQAFISTDNSASYKVLDRLGMTREAVLKNYWYIKGQFKDIFVYSILNSSE